MKPIRAARPDEAEDVLALWRAADTAPSATDDIEGIRTLLARDPEALLVWEDAGGIVGTLIVVFDGWRGHSGVGGRARWSSASTITRAVWRDAGYEHDARIDRYGKMLSRVNLREESPGS